MQDSLKHDYIQNEIEAEWKNTKVTGAQEHWEGYEAGDYGAFHIPPTPAPTLNSPF